MCAVLAFALMAYAIARARWRNRGVLFVFFAIFISAQIWLVSESVYALWADNARPALLALVCGLDCDGIHDRHSMVPLERSWP